jgi:hypothetical protein
MARRSAFDQRGLMEILYILLVLPFALGWGLALVFLPDNQLRAAQSLFSGVALAITAVLQTGGVPGADAFVAGLFESPTPPPPVVASMYSAVVLTAIATTFATPIGLKWIYGKGRRSASW